MKYLKKFKSYILVVGVIIIPLLYSFFYLQAFWDPYNTLKTVPVAIVNEDKGAVVNGASRNLGREAVKKLIKDGSLKFVVTDAANAESGAEGTKYYAVIKFPKDFSANIASSATTDKKVAIIDYKANNKRNYIASQIMKNLVTKIEESTRGSIDKEITATLVTNIKEVPKQLTTLKTGLNTLGNGAAALASGASQAEDGQSTLKNGISRLSSGIDKLSGGADTLSSGMVTFTGKLSQATDGSKKIDTAVKASMPKLTAGIKKLAAGAKAVNKGAQSLLDQFVTSGDAKNPTIYDGVTGVSNGMQTLSKQFVASTDANNPTLYDGVTGVSNGMQLLLKQFSTSGDAKNPTLYDGLKTLNSGTQAYVSAVDNTIYQMIATNPNSAQLLSGYRTNLLQTELAYATATDAATKAKYYQQVVMLADLVNMYSAGTNPAVKTEPEFEAALVSAAKADAKSASLVSNGATLASGSQQFASQFADGGTLKTSVTKLASAAQQTAYQFSDSGTLKLSVEKLAAAAKLVASQFSNGGAFKTGVSKLADGTKQLADGTAQFAGSAGGLNTLSGGINELATGLTALRNGSVRLESGSRQLSNGITTAQSGTSALLTGAGKLADAATQISDGSEKLSNGVSRIKSGVATSLNKANSQLKSTTGLDAYAEHPATVRQEKLNYLPNYGTAFAPYFMSLSLWVGALLMFFGIYLDADERIKVLSRHSDNKVVRVCVFALIGVAQAIALALIVQFALGFKVCNVPVFYVSCILISLVFISIIEFFIVNLKDVGKFLSIACLILNLTACGGTFPMETVPKFFNIIYPYMPMTYSVGLLKESSSNFNAGTAWRNAAVLIGIFVVFTGLTVVFSATRKAKVKVREMIEAQG